MNGSVDAISGASPPSLLIKALETAVLCPTLLPNLFGNICVCLAVAYARPIKRRPSSLILASLAVSDLASLSFVLFRLLWLYNREAACAKYQYFFTLQGALFYNSSIHLFLLSCDRYVAIVHSLKYSGVVTKVKIRRALLVAWGISLVCWIIVPCIYPIKGRSAYTAALVGCDKFRGEPSQVHKVYSGVTFTFFVAIPFLFMIFSYSSIAKIAWSQNSRVWPGENLNPELAELKRKKKKEMKWVKTISIVIGAFVLCYIPLFICAAPPAQLGPNRVPKALQSIVVLMVTMNSALNPIIYTLRSNEFNIAFRNVLSRTCRILSRQHHVIPKQIAPSELNAKRLNPHSHESMNVSCKTSADEIN